MALAAGVTLQIQDGRAVVTGAKGTLSYTLPLGIEVEQEGSEIKVTRQNDEQQTRAFHGLVRALLQSMVQGVSKGFEKRLEIIGVGYRAQASGSKLNLSLGFSHPVELTAPQGITIKMDETEKNILIISGIDKQVVGEFAANVRKLRKPEPYKGKGIRYVGERVVRKAGKAAAAK